MNRRFVYFPIMSIVAEVFEKHRGFDFNHFSFWEELFQGQGLHSLIQKISQGK